MSFVEDVFKGGNIVTALAIGIGGAILAPVVLPIVGGIVKPVAKVALRGTVTLYEKGREAAVGAGEAVSDLVAEVKAELEHGKET